MRISEQNVIVTIFTATGLSELFYIGADKLYQSDISGEGIPYNVSITPVNLAGPGSIYRVNLFTSELSMIIYILTH